MNRFQIVLLVLLAWISIATQPTLGDELNLVESDDSIRITLRGKPVLQYIKKSQPVPNGLPQHFSRSGYIHPVYTPTGQELTGDYPADHAHQHALFFAWVKSKFDEKNVDFWNQTKDLGKIEFRKVLSVSREDLSVSFSVQHAFMVKDGEGWIDALHEVWTVTVHQTPADHFLFDIVSVQQCASDKPLSLAEYHYGGMAIRGNFQWLKGAEDHSMNPGDLKYLTSDGKDRWEGNHTRPNWVAFSGKIDGQDVSATVFCSPKNFRAPQHVRIHPNKPYFCFAPMVEGSFEIAPGKEYVSRYRYLVTSKSADLKTINEHWRQYTKGVE
ncbi:MAG: PmoA family protein [Pirellulaceae bacterium]